MYVPSVSFIFLLPLFVSLNCCVFVRITWDKGQRCLEFHLEDVGPIPCTYVCIDVADVCMEDFCRATLCFAKLHSWQLQQMLKFHNSFPSNENGWSSKFQYDIIRPTITLTSIYLQLAFIVIGRAAEILHEGSREISMEKYGQKENLPSKFVEG